MADAPSKTRILIVEDDPKDQELLLRDVFSHRTDVEPWIVFTAEEAIQCLRYKKFQLVLLDLNLAAMLKDGLAVIRESKAMRVPPPIAILSGSDGGPLMEAAQQAGVIATVMKPLTGERLNQLLEMVWV